MLYRSDLYVCGEGPDGLKSEIAVKIHGAVMKNIPTEYAGPISKLCKCNFHQYFDNTKITAKQGNAEERPDAGCGIKR